MRLQPKYFNMITPYGLKVASSTNNKFGAKKTEYDGIMYDSRKEAEFARTLHRCGLAKNAKDRVIFVLPQFKFDFYVKDKKIFTYICDFKVQYADGSWKYFDVKGYKKGAAYNIFIIKKKCIEAQENIVILEV